MSKTRIQILWPAFCILIIVSVFNLAAVVMQRTDAADSKESKLKQLMNEKLTILQQVVDQKEELHKLKEMSHKEVYEAHEALHRAQLDLCETDKERIAILEKLLIKAREREAMHEGLPKTTVKGLPEGASLLKLEEAKIDRLNIEIELERIKSK